ncbi:MAG: uroporphyrinogen-III C-methyltransferase [Hellea sp.]|nr:uroporphyrinogen-III C-methyltransferase [Hellea sp.]
MRYLPIFVDTENKTILVVGGGAPAAAKIRTLIKTEATIKIVSPTVTADIKKYASENAKLSIEYRSIQNNDFDSVDFVYIATTDAEENKRLSKLAIDRGLMVNVADQKQDCSFISPAIVDRSPVVVAIGSEGAAPGLARTIKADIEARLPTSTGKIAFKIKELRSRLSRKFAAVPNRQRFWAEFFPRGQKLEAFLRKSPESIESLFEQKIAAQPEIMIGTVTLVGAGPGNLDLLTIGAQRKLHAADVIVYDRLVSQEILDMGRREARYIYVGKAPGDHTTRQEEINRILVEEALSGYDVVRLKGGDPLIFGRADEEIEALEMAAISYEIIPGITAAAAAAASIGASLTSRGHNRSIALLTGHDTKGFAEHDWASLARPESRAAIYMGLGAARFIQGRLMLHGAKEEYRVTVVENASRSDEKIVATTLGALVQDIEKYGIKGPAVVLLGFCPKQAGQADIKIRSARS